MTSDPTFLYRAAAGVAVLLAWATWDWVKKASAARMREYTFLFAVTLATIGYAVLHDALTFSMSYDYFALGKGLGEPSFWPDVCALAAKAGWTAGLAIGMALLVANNPKNARRQLPYRTLGRATAGPLLGALLCAALGAACASLWPDVLRARLHVLRFESGDPDAFLRVWCVHIGSYVGAVLGLVASCLWIGRTRHAPVMRLPNRRD